LVYNTIQYNTTAFDADLLPKFRNAHASRLYSTDPVCERRSNIAEQMSMEDLGH